MVQSLFLKHVSALMAATVDVARESAGATTLSFALEQLAMGGSLIPSNGTSVSKSPLSAQIIQDSGAHAGAEVPAGNVSPLMMSSKRGTKQSISNIKALKAAVSTSGAFAAASIIDPVPAELSAAVPPAIPVPDSQSQVVQPEFFDIESLRRICGDSGMTELVTDFLRTGERILLELDKCAASGDTAACANLASELKKSAGSLGASAIVDGCSALEALSPTELTEHKALYGSLQKTFDALRKWVAPRLNKPI
jgi:HPt (histidine-containing phosphotransfer) domain-containing protein